MRKCDLSNLQGRAANLAALLIAAFVIHLQTGCTKETLSSREQLLLASQPTAGGTRTITVEDRIRRPTQVAIDVEVVTRIATDGTKLPVVSPDGRKLAYQRKSNANWAVQIGDPLPPEGMQATIEAISLNMTQPGAPLSTLTGPWILGRGATDSAYLAERPRADGGRDVALVKWTGSVRMIAEDDWCNAFATVAPDGSAAWCRRRPEGGDWQLVCDRGGVRKILPTTSGQSWLMPVFGGDGTGIFCFRLDGTSLVIAWLPFGDDGLPSLDATLRPELVGVVSVTANLSWAVRASEPVSGLAAAPPRRERVAFWLPDARRMALWAPGGTIEALTEGSFCVTVLDPENALVTVGDRLLRERLGVNPRNTTQMTSGAWMTRPTTLSASQLVGFRADGGELEIARLRINSDEPNSETETSAPQ